MKLDRTLAIILTLAIAVSFANIGGLDIYALDEAKNAEAARHMFVSGDYVVPSYNGEVRTDKPPLHYYFMSLGYGLFGVNPFGARFMSSVFGVLTVLLVYLFGIKHFNQQTAIYSSLVLISSLHFNLQMHMSVPDPYLIFFLTWAFFSFYNAYQSDGFWAKISFYFAIGCGLLLKGPIALGLTGLTALIFLLLKKDFKWPTVWRLQPFGGLILSLAIALPWYYAVHQATDGFWTEEFFFKHNFSRYSDAMEGHNGIFLLTLAYVFVLGMLTMLPVVFQSFKWAILKRSNDALFYVFTGASVIIAFFASSSTKLPNYTTPSYPLISLLLGYYISNIKVSWYKGIGNKIGYYFYAILMLIFPAGLYLGLKGDPNLAHLSYLGLYFIPLSFLGAYLFYQGIKGKSVILAMQASMVVWTTTTLLFFYLIFPQVDAENPTRKLIPYMDTQAEIISYKRLNAAFVFELQREIPKYNEIKDIREAIASAPKGYVISRRSFREELEQIEELSYVDECKDTFENPTSLLMKWGD